MNKLIAISLLIITTNVFADEFDGWIYSNIGEYQYQQQQIENQRRLIEIQEKQYQLQKRQYEEQQYQYQNKYIPLQLKPMEFK